MRRNKTLQSATDEQVQAIADKTGTKKLKRTPRQRGSTGINCDAPANSPVPDRSTVSELSRAVPISVRSPVAVRVGRVGQLLEPYMLCEANRMVHAKHGGSNTQGMYTPRACARRSSNSGQRHWHVTVRSWQRFCCPRPPTIPAPSVCTSWRKDSRTGGRTAPSSSRLSSTWLAHLSIERNEPPHHHVHVRTRARALCPTR